MSLTVCILGSGSSGNSTYVATPESAILIDSGLSAKQTALRLEQIGTTIENLQGICLSHEHSDHTAGLRVLNKKKPIPVYANSGTKEAVLRDEKMNGLSWRVFTNGSPFRIKDITIEPFSVPHDAYDPVGFIISCHDARVGVVTDAGMVTTLMRERLRSCHAIVIEANHDEQLLQEAPRPWSLKQRIMGRQGHLSNQKAGELLADIAHPHLESVFLAHLSEDCNREELALRSIRQQLERVGQTQVRVELTYPDRPSVIWSKSPYGIAPA